MSNIWDAFEDESPEYVDGFPVPDEAQFSDLEDFAEGDSAETYSVRGDFKVLSIRGTKDTKNWAGDKAHVVNIRVKGAGDFDKAGEAEALWVTEYSVDPDQNEWAHITQKQLKSIGLLLSRAGLLADDALGEFDPADASPGEWMDAVAVMIDAGARYNKDVPYTFEGQVSWDQKWNTKHGKAFRNVKLYINKCPKTELPF